MVLPAILAGAGVAFGAFGAYKADKEYTRASEVEQRAVDDLIEKLKAAPLKKPTDPQYAGTGVVFPDYEAINLTPEEIKLLQKFTPTIAKHVEEVAPQLVKGATREKDIQRRALERYEQLSTTGVDAISKAQQAQAAFQADQLAKARQSEALRGLASKGIVGGGAEILAATGAAEQASAAARQQSLDAAAQAQGRRLQALGAMSSLAGQMRAAEEQTEQTNVALINAFNERAVRQRNLYNQYVAQQQTAADQYNIGAAQRIHEANIAAAQRGREMTQAERTRRAEHTAGLKTQEQQVADRREEARHGRDMSQILREEAKEKGILDAETAREKLKADKYLRKGQMYSQLGQSAGSALLSAGISGLGKKEK